MEIQLKYVHFFVVAVLQLFFKASNHRKNMERFIVLLT